MIWDFLIIGGGIAGVSAAARLAPLGRVCLLEGEGALAYHASGRSAALFEESYGKPAVVALNSASKAFHMDPAAGFAKPRGLMILGRRDEADGFDADVATLCLDRISPSDAKALVPIIDPQKVALAAYHDSAWDLDTDKIIQSFVRCARADGAQITTHQRVTALRKQRLAKGGGYWLAETQSGQTFEARMVINAAGAWADDIAQMAGLPRLGLIPYRRSMARIPAPGNHDVSAWPMIFGVGESWYAKPDAGKLLVSPAEEDPMPPHDAFADDLVLAEGLHRYSEMVTEPVTRLETSWAGLRTFAPDRALVIGPAPQDHSFIWLAGQGGYGFQTAPAASQLTADLIAARPSELSTTLIAALSPARFS